MKETLSYEEAVGKSYSSAKEQWEDVDPCLIFSCAVYEENYRMLEETIVRTTYRKLIFNYPEYAERYRLEKNI